MIFDPKIELELLESQPEWSGVHMKIDELKKEIAYWNKRLDKDPADWIVKKINLIEKDLKMFENILFFWSNNYQKLARVSCAIEKQAKAANNGADLLDLIDDLREAYKYIEDENLTLSETFIKLAETRNLDAEKIDKVLKELRVKTAKYWKYINTKIDQIVEN